MHRAELKICLPHIPWRAVVVFIITHVYPYYLKKKEKKRYFLRECNAFCNFFFFLVLPKFDVMITTPLYYSLREEDVTGVVTAK